MEDHVTDKLRRRLAVYSSATEDRANDKLRITELHVQIPPHGVPSQLRTGDVLHRVATRVLRNGGTLQPLPRSYCVGTRQRGAVLQRSLAVTL